MKVLTFRTSVSVVSPLCRWRLVIAVGDKSVAVQPFSSESVGWCVRWRCTVHVGFQYKNSAASFWRWCGQSHCTMHRTRLLTMQSDAACLGWLGQKHRLLWHCLEQSNKGDVDWWCVDISWPALWWFYPRRWFQSRSSVSVRPSQNVSRSELPDGSSVFHQSSLLFVKLPCQRQGVFTYHVHSHALSVYHSIFTGWPLVWKTGKCHGNLIAAGKCQGINQKSGNCLGKSCCRKPFIVDFTLGTSSVFSSTAIA